MTRYPPFPRRTGKSGYFLRYDVPAARLFGVQSGNPGGKGGHAGVGVLTDEEEEDASKIPEIKTGDALKLKELGGNQHFTQPPARYTEASLVKKLEETGVGRPSTYVSIVSTITGREYVVREQKQLKPTELGEAVTKLLKEQFPNIVNVKFTANMESDLDKVEHGEVDYIAMLHAFYDDFEDTLQKAKEKTEGVKIKLKEDETLTKYYQDKILYYGPSILITTYGKEFTLSQ